MRGKVIALAGWLLLASGAGADELVLHPSARLLFKEPELARTGACAMYREGGSGWIFTDPAFWLKGTVISTAVVSRKLQSCPEVPGKLIEQYSREEFNRLAASYPCLGRDEPAREEQIGMVRLRVEEWETAWGKRFANAGRLHQGHFIDRPLEPGGEMEIEADLLDYCSH